MTQVVEAQLDGFRAGRNGDWRRAWPAAQNHEGRGGERWSHNGAAPSPRAVAIASATVSALVFHCGGNLSNRKRTARSVTFQSWMSVLVP